MTASSVLSRCVCSVLSVNAGLCLLLIGMSAEAQNAGNPPTGRKDCGSGVQVTAEEVFSGMVPPPPRVPESCKNAAWQLSERFTQEDRNNWEALSNRACSAKLGWVENSPGICSAGGPPPICKRTDHWHRDLAKADYEWKKFKHDQFAEPREKQIADAGCGCWLDAISSQSQDRTPAGNFNPYSPTQSGYNPYSEQAIVPCTSSSDCQVPLPGSVCSAQKSCVTPGEMARQTKSALVFVDGKLVDKAKDAVIDLGETKLLNELPSKFAALATEVGEKFIFRTGSAVVFGLLETQDLDSLLPSYKASLGLIHDNVTTLKNEYVELGKMVSNKSPRAPYSRNELIAEIVRTKAELRMNMDNANGFLAGVVRDKQMHPGACYNVLEFQNSSVMANAATILSLPDQGLSIDLGKSLP